MNEQMKKNLEIIDFEDKKTKTDGKRYTRFKTPEGWMSCFDEISSTKLKGYEGRVASVEVIKSGEYQNIKKCYGDADGDADQAEVEVVKPGVPQETKVSSNKNATMYVSYVKDLIVAGSDVDAAIIAITKAKEAFE